MTARDQHTRDPLRVDLDALDPHGDGLLEAQRLAAEKQRAADREWRRLRQMEAFTKRIAGRLGGVLTDDEIEELRRLLWTHGDGNEG